MSNNEWNNNALDRYEQVISGKDLTFSLLFLPLWTKIFMQNEYRSVLEIGSGPGVLSGELSKYVDSLVCIDKDKKMIQIAREHNTSNPKINFIETSIEMYNPYKQFDSCIAHMVIHNIPDYSKVLNQINKHIKMSGDLFFSIPHPCFYHLFKSDELTDFKYTEENTYLIDFTISLDNEPLNNKINYHHRTLQTYIKELSSNGFVIVNIEEVFPTEDTMRLYPIKWTYPRYILIHAKKTISLDTKKP